MSLPAGFPIFRTGDPATALYLIKDGSVRVAVISSSGKSIDVATLGSGSHFGEMALIDGAKRSATAETLEPTSHVPLRLRQGHGAARSARRRPRPSSIARLARFLSNRLRQTTTDMSYAREKNLRHF